MDTEEKIAFLKSLQSDIGKPSNKESTFTPKSTKEELTEFTAGVLVATAITQYVYFGIQTLTNKNSSPIIIATIALTLLCVVADRIHPIQRIQAGEAGIASSFNFLVINFMFYSIFEGMLVLAILALLFLSEWHYALFSIYPILLIEWIKRKNIRKIKQAQQGSRGNP